jgi:HSP20 family protein
LNVTGFFIVKEFVMGLPIRVQRVLSNGGYDAFGRDVGSVVDRLLSARNLFDDARHSVSFAVDVREDADNFYVSCDLPGIHKDDIDITLENATLTITAERRSQQENVPGEWLLREREQARVSRSFTLPPTVSDASVEAKLADGVLHLTLKKREETKPRKIAVS